MPPIGSSFDSIMLAKARFSVEKKGKKNAVGFLPSFFHFHNQYSLFELYMIKSDLGEGCI